MTATARVLARVPGEAADEIARLQNGARTPIGAAGKVMRDGGALRWAFGG
jgi:hypothetical protein